MRALFALFVAFSAFAACDSAVLAPPPADATTPPGITFATERDTYPVGATVSVVLVNGTSGEFLLPYPANCLSLEVWSGSAWRAPRGQALSCRTVVEEVEAGRTVRAQVPALPQAAGTYRVVHGFSPEGLRTPPFVVE